MKVPAALFPRLAGSALLLSMLGASAASSAAEESQYRELMWIDLMPFEEMRALMNPPPMLHLFGEEGDSTQALRRNTDGEFSDPGSDAYEKALVSTNVKPELNGIDVSLPGFVVPLEYNEEQRVTEFFLVPYFGACLHVPPPPPNQLVYVSYPEGLELESIFDPYSIEGRILTEITDNAMALAAYKIEAAAITLHEPEEMDADYVE